ncbi:PucR family transcriptional regulator ligand-binding domain-containing protein [Pseudogracilibacillus sp. SE30717A]|uniref:PucR family transcriptional regulator n=1 Tax=Pseudogracilibacillus sp. SE30717A TaxID=3098293 RepID=UPI00300DD42B
MSLSLKNSMKLGKFGECEVVAGHQGMDRMIENITIMEVPDIVKWLKGRELILTSLFAIKNDKDAQNLLIQRLYYAGATALAIKPFESMGEIPEGIIESANKLGFPVIWIPNHIKYLDILSPVMHYIFNEKVVLQEDIEQATNVLQEISLNSQGLDVFVENVSSIMKNIITVESEFTYIKVPKPNKPISPLSKDQKHELSIIKRPIRYERQYGDEDIPCIVAPLIVDGEFFGNVTCWAVNNKHLTIDLAILEKASTLLSLEFLKVKVKYDMEQQYKNDFMRELIFNVSISDENLIEWGSKYFIKKDTKYFCMLLGERVDNLANINNVIEKAEINSLLMKDWPKMLLGIIRNKICMILPVENREIKKTCKQIFRKVKDVFGQELDLCAGIGEVYEGPQGIRKSFFQAEQAFKLKKMAKDSIQIIYYSELGAYRLLGPLIGKPQLNDFYEETIGKLVNQDPKGEFVKTLRVYFANNEALKITASELFIHVNTLKYRMNRIEEITGLNLRKTEDKMNLYLGLKAFELLTYQQE